MYFHSWNLISKQLRKIILVRVRITSKVLDSFCTWPDHFLVWLELNSLPDRGDLTCPSHRQSSLTWMRFDFNQLYQFLISIKFVFNQLSLNLIIIILQDIFQYCLKINRKFKQLNLIGHRQVHLCTFFIDYFLSRTFSLKFVDR